MADDIEETEQLLIEDEMKESYLTYAMSVIVSRALPEVRDGLKPVQRRILVGANQLNLGPRSKTRKCGKIVGDVGGNYHPHGDTAIYDALVRLAQPFSMRYPLIDGQGNFGSMDGDPPAAMRYTEARLTAIGSEMLDDLNQDTVDFVDNYDNTREEPVVLPGRFPNLLANGTSGIAVGMATSLLPHNLTEICDATITLIDQPDVTVTELMDIIPGPDFPTGGVICGRSGIQDGYTSGRGTLTVRARTEFEESKRGRDTIVVTEVPYRTSRDNLTEKIADAVQSEKVSGISDIRNESDREGTRIAIDLKRGADKEVVLNQLFKRTPLQTSVSMINIAIMEGRPETLNLKDMLQAYIDHRVDVIERRTRYQLAKAEDRAHVLDGLKIALINIDEVIEIVRSSDQTSEAQQRLMNRFELTERQADAILAMRLSSLVGLERIKIEKEHEELQAKIRDYKEILSDRNLVLDIIREDLYEIKDKYGDERRTSIEGAVEDLEREDLIREEDVVVTITHRGYVKRTKLDAFRAQGRGGKGVRGADLKEEDFVSHLFSSSTHDYIMFFTNEGLVYWLKVFEIPEMGRARRGRALVNLLDVDQDERITGVIPVSEFEGDAYLLMATAQGKVKKTSLDAFGKRGSGGIIAINLNEDDRLIGVRKTSGNQEVMLSTAQGRAIKFHESDVRAMGRNAAGVRGIKLQDDDHVVALAVVPEEIPKESICLLTVCENGYGKRTCISEYPLQGRGGLGVIDIKTPARNGNVVAAREVIGEEHLMMITERGMMVRTPVESTRSIGRNTQGVKLITTDEDDKVSAVVALIEEEDEEEAEAHAPEDDQEDNENEDEQEDAEEEENEE